VLSEILGELDMDLSRRASMAGLLAVVAAPGLIAAKPAGQWTPVDAMARKMVGERLAPGMQICVRRRGATVFSRGFGEADLETRTPMTPATVCRIGSVSKQFTAAGVLLLAQDGKMGLDDPLSRFLPDFPNADRLTIRRLLSHTSGLGNYTETTPPELIWQMARTDRNTDQMLDLMRAASAKLLFEPGTNYRYSNTGFVLLGIVIEKVSGLSYRDFMQGRLFTPLGLARTAVDDVAEVVAGRAVGYTDDPKAPTGFDNASFTSMTFPGGAGALRSTCGDLCAWHEALLGGKVLQPAMLKAMLTPITLNDGALPMQTNRKGERTPVRYGFGIGLNPADGHASISHGGSIQGFGSFLETLPDDKTTMALIINTDGGAKAPAEFGPTWAELQKVLRTAALAA
jgi:D-alanyl-D-alanine carboxypeptidase